MSKPVLLAFHSDQHTNDTAGLCPPKFTREYGSYSPTPAQLWLWRSWCKYWEQVAALKKQHSATVISVYVGDVGDLNSHSSAELVTTNDQWIVEGMVDAAAPGLEVADHTIVIRGTAAHSGGSGKLEDLFAERINAIPREVRGENPTASWYVWTGDFDGLEVLATHHPASGSRIPDKIDDACNRSCAFVYKSYDRCRQRPPDWCVWGHFHKRAIGTYLAGRLSGRYLPSWKLVGNFGYRLGTVTAEPVGGWYLLVKDGKVAEHDFVTFTAPRRRPWTLDDAQKGAE